jgi:hypothetical protein
MLRPRPNAVSLIKEAAIAKTMRPRSWRSITSRRWHRVGLRSYHGQPFDRLRTSGSVRSLLRRVGASETKAALRSGSGHGEDRVNWQPDMIWFRTLPFRRDEGGDERPRPRSLCSSTIAPHEALVRQDPHCLPSCLDQGDTEVAAHLLDVLEFMINRAPHLPDGRERRTKESLVAAHERLWQMRHPALSDC